MFRQFCLSALLVAPLLVSAHADEPYWSLSVGTPGLAANVGNMLAPPVVYAPPPPPVVYYAPAYGPVYAAPPAYGWRRREHWRHHDDDEGWHRDR